MTYGEPFTRQDPIDSLVGKVTTMRMDYAGRGARTGLGRVRAPMMRLAGLFLAGAVLLAIVLVGLFLVLPVMLVGGIALSFYLRRRLRRAKRRKPQDGVIDAEYTVIDRR